MIRDDWNALQVGDHVLVHDATDGGAPVVPGRVVKVRADQRINDIAIRIKPAGRRHTIVHPRRLAVHLEELDPDRRCWRCDAHAATDSSATK